MNSKSKLRNFVLKDEGSANGQSLWIKAMILEIMELINVEEEQSIKEERKTVSC